MNLDLSQLNDATLFITGGTGMIGKWMIDTLLNGCTCKIIVAGRSMEKFLSRFKPNHRLTFYEWDASSPTRIELVEKIDYIIHFASNTHPVAYASDPVSTIVMNVTAAKELLDLSVRSGPCRVVYASSVEIYGQNRGDCEKFKENYCGYIDSNTLRAGYPESKRCGEALCQAYAQKHQTDFVIPRIARVYGPTLLKTDTKALSQFLNNALDGKDIVLKSEGRQHFSYLHVADAVSGILTVMLRGHAGEAYNISDEASDITLRDLARLVAKEAGCEVIFDIPAATEMKGFSTAMVARMDSTKLKQLGWSPQYSIETGIHQTFLSLKGAH